MASDGFLTTKFTCPVCSNKLPFKEVFRFNKGHVLQCPVCDSKLRPVHIKSWNFGFVVGFLGVVVHALLVKHYWDSFMLAALIGLTTGGFTIMAVASFTYLNTDFEEIKEEDPD